MYNRVFKNYQVNIGNPFQVRIPLNLKTMRPVSDKPAPELQLSDSEEDLADCEDTAGFLEKAREEAGLIVREAELEAAGIIEKAKASAEKLRQEISEEARQAGYRNGIEAAQKQYEDMLKEAEIIKAEASAEYGETLSNMEKDIVEMILSISRKVIGEKAGNDSNVIMHLVKDAFEKCTSRGNVTLRVSPGDYDILEENKGLLQSMTEDIGEFNLKKDRDLQPGSCILDTPAGSMDAGVETKLAKIEENFRKTAGI